MRSFIVDIKDLSNSKEVYDTRPNPFFAIFIYGLLVMLIAALCFSYFFKIDIVVKSDGIIRTNEDISTVTNTLAGELTTINITDGCSVKKGDILYVIQHDDLLLQKADIEQNMSKTQIELENLNKYKSSIEEENNLFTNAEEEYYTKYMNYYVNLLTLENNEENSSKSLATQLASVQKKLSDYENNLTNTEKLISLITSGADDGGAFENDSKYDNIYEKYISDHHSIITQYDDKTHAIESDASGDMNAYSIIAANADLNGYNLLLNSIKMNASQFIGDSIYNLLYSQYQAKMNDLNGQYEQARDMYNINASLIGIGVSVADVNSSQDAVAHAYAAMAEYKNEYITNLVQKINELTDKISQLNINKTAITSKDELLAENNKEKAAALDNHKLDTLVSLNSQADQLNENIRSLYDNEESLLSQMNNNLSVMIEGKSLPAKVVAYKQNELNAVISSIKGNDDNLNTLETNLARINEQINNAVVCAQSDGVVNLYVDLVKGDVLQSGTSVLTVVPSNTSKFKVNIYVADKDIAKLKEGMKVKYDIYALPAAEYGDISGTVTSISKDLKTNASNQSAYYLIEATLDNTRVIDYEGNNAAIKVGMTCKASMITEQKQLINYLLEKINLLD